MFLYTHILFYYKLFFHSNLCLSVMLDSLSCSLTSMSYFPMLPVFLDCPFLIAVIFIGFSVVFFCFRPVFYFPMLPVSLDCPFLIAVIFIGFSVVFCLFSSSVLFPNVASVSGLSILDCRHLYRFLCCVLFVFVQCFISQCCQCFWIVHS